MIEKITIETNNITGTICHNRRKAYRPTLCDSFVRPKLSQIRTQSNQITRRSTQFFGQQHVVCAPDKATRRTEDAGGY
jgi:hypothetical protein